MGVYAPPSAAGFRVTKAVAASTTGLTTEVVLATIVIPANAMGPSGQVEIMGLVSFTLNNANVKTLRVNLGATNVYSVALSSNLAAQFYVRISNRTASSQITFTNAIGFNQSTVTPVVSAIDTTQAVTLTITGQLATTTDTFTLESYMLRVTPGG